MRKTIYKISFTYIQIGIEVCKVVYVVTNDYMGAVNLIPQYENTYSGFTFKAIEEIGLVDYIDK
jgi:hypothetical protein